MHRSDAMRYFILHQFGGVYADLDMECLRPLDHVTRKFSCIFPPEPFFNSVFGLSWPYIINNAIMMCKPGHPFLEYLMHDLEKTATRKEILYVAGPAFVTEEYVHKIHEKIAACAYWDEGMNITQCHQINSSTCDRWIKPPVPPKDACKTKKFIYCVKPNELQKRLVMNWQVNFFVSSTRSPVLDFTREMKSSEITRCTGPVIPEIKLESDPHDNPRLQGRCGGQFEMLHHVAGQHGSRSTTPMGAVDSNRLKTE
ncbi:IMT1-like protein [Mya arenaria]|uniref:IMT1-like protein n=1 Tax=Mya arenaria TaxID=6604 RepID=A0ABY7DES7_MYAAR|nr:IMT1-like protein [Mya arenaria]